MKPHRLLMLICVAGLHVGCDGDIAEIGPGGDIVAGSFDDDEIAAAMRAINVGAVALAQSARPRLFSPALVDYTTLVIEEHTLSNDDLTDAVTEATLFYDESDLSEELLDEYEDSVEDLAEADADDVDDLYIAHEQSRHDDALNIIQDELLDDVDHPVLRDYLERAASMEAGHLGLAGQLNGGCCVPLEEP